MKRLLVWMGFILILVLIGAGLGLAGHVAGLWLAVGSPLMFFVGLLMAFGGGRGGPFVDR